MKRKHKPPKTKRSKLKLIVSIPHSSYKTGTPLKDFTVRVPRSRLGPLPPRTTLDYSGGFAMVEGHEQMVPVEYPKRM